MFIMLMMISLYSLYFGNSIILNNFNYLHDKSSSSIIMSSSSYAQIYINKLGGTERHNILASEKGPLYYF